MATDAAKSTNTNDNNTPNENLDTPISPPATDKPSIVAKSNSDDPATAAAVSDTEKKIRRAERFGITVQLSEQEKRNSRAERFGTAPVSKVSEVSKTAEDLKRKARAERFGITVPPGPADEDAKKKARLERFATSPKANTEKEDKRKAKAARFSQTPSDSPSVNGKEDIKPNAPIESKAGVGGA